jgi:hypothetical protein
MRSKWTPRRCSAESSLCHRFLTFVLESGVSVGLVHENGCQGPARQAYARAQPKKYQLSSFAQGKRLIEAFAQDCVIRFAPPLVMTDSQMQECGHF